MSTLILSASSGLTNFHIRGILKQLPNVRCVDLSYTNVSSEAVVGLARFGALKNLEELNLSGCRFVNDLFLEHLAKCYVHQKTNKNVVSNSCTKNDVINSCNVKTADSNVSNDVSNFKTVGSNITNVKTVDTNITNVKNVGSNVKSVILKSRLRKLSLSGCRSVSSVGVERLQIHKTSLQELDLVSC